MNDETGPSPEELDEWLEEAGDGLGCRFFYRGRDSDGRPSQPALTAMALEREGKGTLGISRFIASTGNVIRNGDFVMQGEWQLANYRRVPSFLFEHNPRDVVGRGAVKQRKDAKGEGYLWAQATWQMHESNPLGIYVANQHHQRFRSAVSVGFQPETSINRTTLPTDDPLWLDPTKIASWRAGRVHRRPQLLEISSVATPMDPTAVQIQSWHEMLEHHAADAPKDPTGDPEALDRFFREWMSRNHAEILVSAFRSADPQLRGALRALVQQDASVPVPVPAPPAPPDPVDGIAAYLEDLEF